LPLSPPELKDVLDDPEFQLAYMATPECAGRGEDSGGDRATTDGRLDRKGLLPRFPGMSPPSTAVQRDALHGQILDRLSGIGDIEVAIRRNHVVAERFGREYSDELRLLLDDLGVGDRKCEPSEPISGGVV
jgi:hypothetical protein